MLATKIIPKIVEQGQVSVPNYDRSKLEPGILHLGVGNFFRSFLCHYMEDALERAFEANRQWGIVGAGVMVYGFDKRVILQPQDWLQTLVSRDSTTERAKILQCMIDYKAVDYKHLKEHNELQDMLADPCIKIITLTITEGGYFLSNGEFNVDDDQLQHDIHNRELPHTIFGLMVRALKKRRAAGMGGFTLLSLDNIPHNGQVAKNTLLGVAQAIEPELVDWIKQNVSFPNSMVGRITPRTTKEMCEHISTKYCYEDKAPVFCEPFRQWVMEDNFIQGRPDWKGLENVEFVQDVAPYELMKLRILNGGHASLCYPAALLELEYVDKAMDHPVLGPFVDTLERLEIIPTVLPVPNTNLVTYWETVQQRFRNPTIEDTIERNCYDGSSRQPKFIVPVAKDALLRQNSPQVEGLALVSASWCRYCMGTTETGKMIDPNDPIWDQLHETALKAKTNSKIWLDMEEIYGDLGKHPVFVDAFSKALSKILNLGIEAAMREYVDKCKK